MAVQPLIASTLGARSDTELKKRTFRWRFFRIGFGLLYLGVMLDIITTALGFLKGGAKYEQNPLGGVLIGGLGWIGMAAIMTVLCAVCYFSFRTVYWRMALRWSAVLNTLLVFVVAFRWLVVVTAVLYILQPS
ncbi:MAG: hypothetical protein ACR2JC_09305 [Chloroflexota bacterium]